MKKNKKIFIIILVIFVIILSVSVLGRNNIIIYSKRDGLYNNKFKITDDTINDVIILWDNKKVIYNNYKGLFLYYLNSNKNKKVDKQVNRVDVINKKYLLYEKNTKFYIYNMMTNKKEKISIPNYFEVSNDKTNLLFYNEGSFNIYNLNKNKIIISIKDVEDYKCINDSCTKLYYINTNRELKINSKNKKIIDKNIYTILNVNKKAIVYTSYEEDKYALKVKKNFSKSIILDTSKKIYDEAIINGNKIYYLVSGVCKESKLSGKNKRIITRNVDSFVNTYNDKIILVKGKDLYINNKKISELINSDNIITSKNKIYYLKTKNDISSLYMNNGNKEKLIAKNVGMFIKHDNNIYYIGDYNVSQKYGNLYKVGSKKAIDKRVTSIVEKSIK